MAMMNCILLVLSLFTTALSIGIKCSEHPGFVPGMQPVFVYAFKTLAGNKHTWMNYHPRYIKHHWSPIDDPSSKKYYGLDWFWANGDDDAAGSEAYVRLYLQRQAKVYLAVSPDWDPDFPSATLPGWKSEGYAERPADDEDFVSGIFQKYERWLPTRVYVFSKTASGTLDLAEGNWIKRNIKGITTSGIWYLMLAEPNGAAPKPPAKPPGVEEEIKPNERCPDSLHDLWVTSNTDDNDPDTRGKKWRTWHPMWDPCHWCGYDHEHGSSAKHIMGYEPKYEYVPWKNGREDEDHRGFKGHVFKVGPYFIYWSLHIQTSTLRRVNTRLHTITFAVVLQKTKELVVEINHKGFFGFLASRAKEPGDFVALSPEEQRMRDQLYAEGGKRNRRAINVIDTDDLDLRFRYREPRSNILRGEYEDWTTGPLCARQDRHGMITTDTTDPITAFKSMAKKVKVQLGSFRGDTFIKSDGSSRILIVNDFQFGWDHCNFKLEHIKGGLSDGGVFYTDAEGVNLVKGPSPTSVRQYIKPGFNLTIEGSHMFEPVEVWKGMYVKDGERGSSTYGFVIDPEGN